MILHLFRPPLSLSYLFLCLFRRLPVPHSLAEKRLQWASWGRPPGRKMHSIYKLVAALISRHQLVKTQRSLSSIFPFWQLNEKNEMKINNGKKISPNKQNGSANEESNKIFKPRPTWPKVPNHHSFLWFYTVKKFYNFSNFFIIGNTFLLMKQLS